jgi:DNA-binding transcriptional regulator GbsR (MarR family)
VNRSVAQVHALLYVVDEPLPAEAIAETLGIARSNVSTAVRELQGFALVSMEHRPGDRRDFFRAKQDPWDMLLAIVEERKRREIDPALAGVRACEAEAAADGGATPPGALARMAAMRELIEQLDELHGRLRRAPRPFLKRALSLGDRLLRLLGR